MWIVLKRLTLLNLLLVLALSMTGVGGFAATTAYKSPTTTKSPVLSPLKAPAKVSQAPSNYNQGYNNNYNAGSYSQPGAYTTPSSGSSYNNNYGGYGTSNYGSTPYGGGPSNMAPLQGRVVTAPAGSVLSATPSMAITSETARVGDRFTATLGNDLAAGGSIVLPAGSQLEAQIVSVVKATHGGRSGTLDVRFTNAILPTGQRIPISARIQTQDGSGLIRGGTVKNTVGQAALRTAVGAGLGAALGTAMGPLSGGRVGRGAIYGTAIGGGLGAANAVWNKGDDATLSAGQPLNVVLDQPVTTSAMPAPSAYSAPGYQQSAPDYNYNGGYSAPTNNNNYGNGYYGN
jgi:hypothetical protein